jgi:capsid portal protein
METLYESVRMELEANRFNAALFENNLNIGAVFSMTEADPNQLEENRRYLIENYAGAENAYNPLLLSGDTKMLRDGAMAIKDINFELLVRIARHRVSAVFGVPESLLGIPDNTNRATANTHEHNTNVNTIRPLRKDINARFTYQFIRRTLGNKTVTLEEPLNSMLPTMEEIEAVNKIAENGILFNDYL